MAERIYVDEERWDDGPSRAHLFRYYAARGYLEKDDVVKDVACGCGYGTAILGRVARHAIGLDYEKEAIGHAKEYHGVKQNNIEFQVADFNAEIVLPKTSVSVSIETIEHLADPQKFANMLKSSTTRLIFLTTPIIPTKHENPHHLHDFTPGQVEALFIDDQWKPFHSYAQGAHGGSAYGGFIFYRNNG
ncbi:MAG: methyltransferase [Podoviridae sp. ctg2L5]|nr:MAG: methyltransferase [Podoviridae sp. ctg2L5]